MLNFRKPHPPFLFALFAALPLTAMGQTVPGEGNACLPSLGNGQICTARDMRLTAELVSGPSSCELGELITLEARVLIGSGELASYGASERYSIAFFIGENGADAINPQPSGTCTVSYLQPNTTNLGSVDLVSGVGPYKELSQGAGAPDVCGDIDSNDYTYHNISSSKIQCRDSDGDGRLDVSAVATWEGNKTTTCPSPPEASDFFPEQSSKCVYDPKFDFDISVEAPPAIKVTKQANPNSLREPGGDVTFAINIENTSGASDTVTITSLIDDVFGDLAGLGDCLLPAVIPPGAGWDCRFVESLTGVAGDIHTNVVTASGADEEGSTVSDSDEAIVVFVAPLEPPTAAMEVLKTGSVSTLPEPGGMVEYSVLVSNTGEDLLTLTTLFDDQVGGSLNGVGTCSLPQQIPQNFAYGCDYELMVSGVPGDVVTNVVTATAEPLSDPASPITANDDFAVSLSDVPANLRLIKTPLQRQVVHPGVGNTADLHYRLELINLSTTDSLTISSLIDVQQEGTNLPTAGVDVLTLGTPAGKTSCTLPQILDTGASGRRYECYFTRSFNGSNVTPTSPPSGTSDVIADTVTATGVDDDGKSVSDSDGAQVFVVASPVGSIQVIKTALPNTLDTAPANVVYTVELINTGVAGTDPVTITSLLDAVEGGIPVDITNAANVVSTTCSVPQDIALGSTYTCTFTQPVDGQPGEGISNILTAEGVDRGGNPVGASDEATVAILPTPLDIDVVKTASRRTAQPDQQVTFTVAVTNNSSVNLFLQALDDSIYGDLNGRGTCSNSVPLAVGATYTCEFTEPVSNTLGPLHVNTVTATAAKLTKALLPGASVSDSDRAFVLVLPSNLTPAVAVPVGGAALLLVVLGIGWLGRNRLR